VTTKGRPSLALLIVNAAVVTYWDCCSKVALYRSVPLTTKSACSPGEKKKEDDANGP
jgi:hypothetical protein